MGVLVRQNKMFVKFRLEWIAARVFVEYIALMNVTIWLQYYEIQRSPVFTTLLSTSMSH